MFIEQTATFMSTDLSLQTRDQNADISVQTNKVVRWVRRTHSPNTVTSATDLSVSVRAQLCHSKRADGSSFCMFLAGFFCHGTKTC